jgi:hypothetical protein
MKPPDSVPRSLHDIWYQGYEAGEGMAEVLTNMVRSLATQIACMSWLIPREYATVRATSEELATAALGVVSRSAFTDAADEQQFRFHAEAEREMSKDKAHAVAALLMAGAVVRIELRKTNNPKTDEWWLGHLDCIAVLLMRPRPTYLPAPAKSEPEHVCGLSGYNGMLDPPCPACLANRRQLEEANRRQLDNSM